MKKFDNMIQALGRTEAGITEALRPGLQKRFGAVAKQFAKWQAQFQIDDENMQINGRYVTWPKQPSGGDCAEGKEGEESDGFICEDTFLLDKSTWSPCLLLRISIWLLIIRLDFLPVSGVAVRIPRRARRVFSIILYPVALWVLLLLFGTSEAISTILTPSTQVEPPPHSPPTVAHAEIHFLAPRLFR